MPDTQVSILKRNGTKNNYYPTYGDARTAAVSGDVIIIWADITNEPVILKNEVDIWIMPGVVINNTSGDTITDKVSGISYEVHCKIYGEGRIINTAGYSCIRIDHANSELTVECNSFDTSTVNSTAINIVRASNFHLTCKSILSKGSAIFLGSTVSIINNVNLDIGRIETGDTSSGSLAATSIVSYANGLIHIGEILCKNRGHCILHKKGDVLAIVKKMTTKYTVGLDIVSAVALIQDNIGTQKLVLYFDEINSIDSYGAIEIQQGTGIFIGRRIYSNKNFGVHITGSNTKGYLRCNEIICKGSGSDPAVALDLGNYINEIIIEANYIEGYRDSGVIYTNGANVLIKNAIIKNTYSGTEVASVGIFLLGDKIISLVNVKIVTGGSSTKTIYHPGTVNIDVKNFGLFVNKEIGEYITLTIGTGLSDPNYNYQYIVDLLLT